MSIDAACKHSFGKRASRNAIQLPPHCRAPVELQFHRNFAIRNLMMTPLLSSAACPQCRIS